METFEEYRALIGGKAGNTVSKIRYTPKNRRELIKAIEAEIADQGPEADLNCIDTSNITNMNELFSTDEHEYAEDFNGDISKWNVSNVEDFGWMFYTCKNFNCDLSNWDTSKATTMSGMFSNCEKFNQDLTSWDTSNVELMDYMFSGCEVFNGDISGWDTSNVVSMAHMFDGSKAFDQNISNWDTGNVTSFEHMYAGGCKIRYTYKPKIGRKFF